MEFEDPEQRGRELRTDLEETYKDFVCTRRLSGGKADITDSVLRYIPIGIDFDEAEAILRGAGFTVGPRPDVNLPPNPNGTKDWHGVLARISSFAHRFPTKVGAYVMLLPKSPGDYMIVASVKASFVTSAP
jgi:hypothetical protein